MRLFFASLRFSGSLGTAWTFARAEISFSTLMSAFSSGCGYRPGGLGKNLKISNPVSHAFLDSYLRRPSVSNGMFGFP
jgi:hypothetical protein